MEEDFIKIFQELALIFSEEPPGAIILGIVALPVLIVEYVKMAKGTSCRWWIEKAERAEAEARTIKATLAYVRRRSRKDGDVYFHVYEYEYKGKTYRKVFRDSSPKADETITLYYSRNPKRAKIYGEFTNAPIRGLWPWIVTIAYMAPIALILKLLGVPIE